MKRLPSLSQKVESLKNAISEVIDSNDQNFFEKVFLLVCVKGTHHEGDMAIILRGRHLCIKMTLGKIKIEASGGYFNQMNLLNKGVQFNIFTEESDISFPPTYF